MQACMGSYAANINPIQDGFSSVTSANVGITPKNFLTFSCNRFTTLV